MHRAVLAQLSGVSGGQVYAPLPKPPLLERYILELPIPVAVALALLGVVFFYAIHARGHLRRAVMVGAALWLAAGSVVLTGSMIQTPRETLTSRTRTLLKAAIETDRSAVAQMVSDRLLVTTNYPDAFAMRQPQFLNVVERMDMLGIRDWSMSPRGASSDAANAVRVDYAVRVTTAGGVYSGATPSVWRFHWRSDRQGEWKLVRMVCLSLWGQAPDPDVVRWANQFLN